MVADVADQPGGLPLLQFALTELFDAKRDGVLGADGYRIVSAGLAFTNDGDVLVSGGGDGVARVWALDVDDLIGIAQDKLTRGLTGTECRE
jgi:WD40 repeat protein